MKIKKIIILIMVLSIINILNVKAVTVIPSGSGLKGDESAACNGDDNCANTVGITVTNSNVNNTGVSKTYTFDGTAIFGMRITLVDKNGKSISGYSPINFWATKEMQEVVGYNTLIKRITTYTNAVDPTEMLYSYKNGGLQQLDKEITNYKDFIFDLTADQVEKYLKSFNSTFTLSSAADKNYFLKCEPIFVYHYHNNKNPQNVYFGGTAKEILTMITNQDLHNCSDQNYCGKVTKYYINQWTLGFLSCGSKIIYNTKIENLTDINGSTCKQFGNVSSIPIIFQYGENNKGQPDQSIGHNIIRNYITTVYQQKNINGTSFPVYGYSITKDTDRLKLYREAMDSDGSGLSVGYIRLKDFNVVNLNITIYKYGNDGKCYDAPAYFELRNNAGNLTVGGSGTRKGFNSWCNADGTAKSVTFKGSEYTSIVLGNTYNLYEFNSITSTSEIKNAQYSVNGSQYKKIDGNRSYYMFKFGKSNTVVKVKNNSDGGECTDSVDCCKQDLSKIIQGCSGNVCSNSSEVATKLLDLYSEYAVNDFNLLLNYEFTNTAINVSQVSCDSTTCSNGGINTPKCIGNSTLSPSTPDNSINRRVCYINNDDSKHASKGSYYYEDIDAYCDLQYNFNLDLPNYQVKAGRLLWQQFPDVVKNIGTVSVSIHCENGYKGVTANNLKNRKLNTSVIFDDIIPEINLKWRTYGSKYTENISVIPKTTNKASTDPSKVECSGSGENEYCYVTWDQEYNFDFAFTSEWYVNDSNGIFSKKSNLSDLSGYSNKGKGLPISIKERTTNSANVDVSIKSYNNSQTFQCPYSVKNEILKCPSGNCDDDDDNPSPLSSEFNFDFRIIDTSNPFPGIDGNGRYVGDNWCVDSRIGKIDFKTSGEKYMIGDVIGDDFTIVSTEYQTNFAEFSLSNKPSADVDGDGAITYSGSCIDTMNDYCILFRYAANANRKSNCVSDVSKNNIIKKYITDAPNSNSTGRPMYSFTLTPDEIQNIRAYNKGHAYNDFNMVCDENERNCLSNFLTDWINNGQVNSKSIKVRVTDTNSSCYNTRVVNNQLCTNN